MFLIRTAFWLSVVVFMIPVDEDLSRQASSEATRPIDAFEAVQVAQSTFDDMGGFCDRNPDTCAIGGRIATTFMLKAQSGARMVIEMIDGQLADGDPAPVTLPAPTTAGGTLTERDLQPAWQGPVHPDPV